MNLGDRYQLHACVATQWTPLMATMFPNADHSGCRQYMRVDYRTDTWVAFDPPRCQDYHCPSCGEQVNAFGHHRSTGTGCTLNQESE